MIWNWWRERRIVFAAVVLFLLGSVLRVWKYWEFPVAGETQDEVAWSLLGSSLLQTGQPVSWSYFQGYQVLKIVNQGFGEVRLVAPALDHPPLFSLIPGTALTLLGKSWEAWPSMKVVRFPMVVLSLMNMALFFFWMHRTNLSRYGKFVAAMLFATIPSFVFLSRLVVSENLLVTWMLLLLIGSTVQKHWKPWYWCVLLLAVPLTKISGGAIGAAVVGWLWMERRERGREFWWALAGLTGGFFLWMLYAAAFDLSLFWHVQMQQSQRDTGFLTLFTSQLFAPTLVEKVFADYWITLGWMTSLAWIAVKGADKKWSSMDRLVAYLFVAQFAFMALSVGEHTVHGWYRIPFLPLFAYFFGSLWQIIADKRSWFGAGVMFLMLSFVWRLSLWMSFGKEMYHWQNTLNRVWLLVVGSFVGIETLHISEKYQRWIWHSVVGSLTALLVVAHVITVINMNQDRYWQDELYLEQGLRP